MENILDWFSRNNKSNDDKDREKDKTHSHSGSNTSSAPSTPRKHSNPSPASSSSFSFFSSITPPTTRKPTSPSKKKTKLTVQERTTLLNSVLETPIIDQNKVRELARDGLPEGRIRAIYWKILLNYLPLERDKWESELATSRRLYNEWNRDLKVDPLKEDKEESFTNDIKTDDVTTEEIDHPLRTDEYSKWAASFKDKDTVHEIEKDVHRTFPYLHFFQIGQEEDGPVLHNPHYRAMRSILFLWAKLNPGIAYVQGMNEVLGPIYYVFATDTDQDGREHAEPDAFFCFSNLMGEIMNNFCKSLDQSSVGIHRQMQKLNDLLRDKDHQLWIDMEEKQLNPQFYSFRWITLLLSQEFELPDVLRLWDTLFSDKRRFRHLLYVCVSMLITIRESLLSGDFAENLKMLQTYPPTDIIQLLQLARDITRPDYKAPHSHLGGFRKGPLPFLSGVLENL